MNTQIENHAREIFEKAKRGEPLTKEEIKILELATPKKNAFNAGKRKIIKTGK